MNHERHLAQEIVDRMFALLDMNRLYHLIQEQAEHKDKRYNIYYKGGLDAATNNMKALRELAEEYGLRASPLKERTLKLVVNNTNKKAGGDAPASNSPEIGQTHERREL